MKANSKKLAFIDESGAFGWKLEKSGTSKFFIVSALIIEEDNLSTINEKLSEIQIKYFNKNEIKSNKIGKSHERRAKIIEELLDLPFAIFALVVDKRKLTKRVGLNYKKTFYKFCNNLVHQKLKEAFSKLVITCDEIGGSEYMKEFKLYFERKSLKTNLFEKPEFRFENSKESLVLQMADIIAGTIAQNIEPNEGQKPPNYLKMLSEKITRLEFYPASITTFQLKEEAFRSEDDHKIATLSLYAAQIFLVNNEDTEDEDTILQILIIKYLITKFEYNKYHKYIPTAELQDVVFNATGEHITMQSFRSRIIAKLRDKNVIITCSKKGYKIPSTYSEILDYINHGVSIILPMISRLKACRNYIQLSTLNKIDIIKHVEYPGFKDLFPDY